MVTIWTKPFVLGSLTLPDKKRSDVVFRHFSQVKPLHGILMTIPKSTQRAGPLHG
jgi:hypothetical protein